LNEGNQIYGANFQIMSATGCSRLILFLLLAVDSAVGFIPCRSLNRIILSRRDVSSSDVTAESTISDRQKQISDEIDWSTVVVNALIASPLYTPIVAMARNTMIKTAASVGVDWKGKALLLRQANDWDSAIESIKAEKGPNYVTPSYYSQPFHGYKDGNLCLESALEQELAGIGDFFL
jgi:hypothetical protein